MRASFRLLLVTCGLLAAVAWPKGTGSVATADREWTFSAQAQ